MDLAPESPSDGGRGIFLTQEVIYRRFVEVDHTSQRACFGLLHAVSRPLHGNETHEHFFDRWKASLEHDRPEFTPDERPTIREYISQDGFWESLTTFERIAREGGSRTLEHVNTDPYCFDRGFRAVV